MLFSLNMWGHFTFVLLHYWTVVGSAAGGSPGNWLQLQMQPLAHWREEESPSTKIRASPPSRNASGNSQQEELWHRELHRALLLAKLQPQEGALGCVSCVAGKKCTHKETARDSYKQWNTDFKFTVYYVIINLKCSCRQRKPLNC